MVEEADGLTSELKREPERCEGVRARSLCLSVMS